ncbi:hypothetical protein [Pyrobaculum aerophilum]|uniref:Uncharacterized protein n=1 Tax=Pyrobaculum aerophilum TaxID=13773 RepID=A0A371R3E8_9CREN|nr:hypothetical protein [Pyrobaculum aerophilum]RFA98331.1 hypothetical protein CGL51_01290 [Pyrobaculum aerophilum]RFB00445.1 hypothetical protein CGL52_00935 [Pyrobaculum aerophilum]
MQHVEFLLRYIETKIGKASKLRYHEDNYAYHLMAWFKDVEVPTELNCFDEERGLLGGRRVFCYDEVEERKLSIVLQISKNKVNMAMVSLFKQGVPLIWPPRKKQ